jgi:hypothetical protein
MPEELNPQIVDDVANADFKTSASIPAALANGSQQNFVSNQQTMQAFMTKSAGNTLNSMDALGIKEGQAISGINSTDIGKLMVLMDAVKANSDSESS